MAMAWGDVAANPEFQKLAPSEQEAARQQYFNSVVAPNVPSNDLSLAKDQFDVATEAKKPDTGIANTTKDVALSGAKGFQEGLASIVGFPTDVYNAAQKGTDWLGKQAAELVTGSPSNAPAPTPLPFGSQFINDQFNKVIPYTPKTTAGEYARTLGQFLPAAGSRPMVQAVVPALASETAGQYTKGEDIEPYARLVGALGGLGAGSLVKTAVGGGASAQGLLANAAKTASPEELIQAQSMMDKAASLGTPINATEAIQFVTNGRTRLADMQRVLENSPQSALTLRDFYSGRPASNTLAAENVFNKISPQSATPSTISPSVQQAAQQEINSTRQAINSSTQPLYDVSRSTLIDPGDFASISKDPSFIKALSAIRGDSELGAQIAGLPDNSVGVLDAVKKQLNTMGKRVSNMNLESYDPNKAALRGNAMNQTRDMATRTDQNYAQALSEQTARRRAELAPLEQGPIGQLAATDTLPGQRSVLFANNPAPGSETELSDAISRISGLNPEATNGLVRQHLEQTFNEANQSNIAGINQFGGAKYAAGIAGNKQQATNLEAIIKSLPDGNDKWQQTKDLLDIFSAQGQRMPTGSATAFNEMLERQMAKGRPISEAMTTAISPMKALNAAEDWMRRWRYGKNAQGAAQVLVDPQGAYKIAQFIGQNANKGVQSQLIAPYLIPFYQQQGQK